MQIWLALSDADILGGNMTFTLVGGGTSLLLVAAASVLCVSSSSAAADEGSHGPFLLNLSEQGLQIGTPSDHYDLSSVPNDFHLATGNWRSFSPDGAAIAVASFERNAFQDADAEIWIYPAGNVDPYLAVSVPDTDDIEHIMWSPDGKTLAFEVVPNGPEDGGSDLVGGLYTAPADGGGEAQFLSSASQPFYDNAYAWSPDGSSIAFIGHGISDTDWHDYIGTIDVATGVATRRTNTDIQYYGSYQTQRHDDYTSIDYLADGRLAITGDYTKNTYTYATENTEADEDYEERGYLGILTLGDPYPDELLITSDFGQYEYAPAGVMVSPDGSHIGWSQPLWDHDPNCVENEDGSWTCDDEPLEFRVMPSSGGAWTTVADLNVFTVEDWQPCPAGICPVFASAEKVETAITLAYSNVKGISASGVVTPAATGKVSVILKKQRAGKWVKVVGKSVTLDGSSGYATRFSKPAAPLCKLIARYNGDQKHLGSQISKLFTC